MGHVTCRAGRNVNAIGLPRSKNQTFVSEIEIQHAFGLDTRRAKEYNLQGTENGVNEFGDRTEKRQTVLDPRLPVASGSFP